MSNLVHNNQLDKQRWDTFVDADPDATIFNKSFYLDTVCDDWYVYHDEVFTYGLVICVSLKLGLKHVYPPFFHRYSDVIGDQSKLDILELEKVLLTEFSSEIFHLSTKLNFDSQVELKSMYYQQIEDEIVLSNLSKRKIKKIQKEFEIELKADSSSDDIVNLIFDVLPERVPFFKSKDAQKLRKLISEAKKEGVLVTLGAFVNKELVGGLIGLNYHNRLLYLKGVCTDDFTEHGMMYYLMSHFNEMALKNDMGFDFGGSNVEGVRYFNQKLGGRDKHYYKFSWDNNPFWYRFMKKMKKRLL